MMPYVAFLLCLLAGSACQHPSDEISVQVCPALLAAEADPSVADWDTVAFAGNERAVAGTYRVDPHPLFTEWNILALHTAPQPDGSVAVTVRLNAYAQRQLAAYGADPVHRKQPLALRIDGRWADFVPVLGPVGDRLTLYGFRPEEARRLRAYLDHK